MLAYWRQERAKRQEVLDRELERIIHILRELEVERVILFGSAARQDVNAYSDLDLIVVLNSSLPFIKRLDMLYERIRPRVGLDLLAYTPQEFKALRERPFIQQAIKEGKVLYEA